MPDAYPVRFFDKTYLPVDGDGLVDPEAVAATITPKTIMISIMHANNEVGTLQPVAEIAKLAREKGILMHTDAAQSVGKEAARVDELGVDLLSVADHKIYAPKGVGALYIRRGVAPEIFCHGAGQERGIRAGTENVLGIVGLGTACELAERELERNAAHMRLMRDRLEEGLTGASGDISFNGHREKRLHNTASVSFLGLAANRILEEIGHTKVCETQTHYLGEQGDRLPAAVKRITVSRDTPFAQARFAREARLEDVQYLSDYKEGPLAGRPAC